MSVNESASIVKFQVVEFTAVMSVKGVPLSILYCADPEISLSKVAVMMILWPAPRRLFGWATESVNVTSGVQGIPHRGKKLGREFTGAERLKFVLLGLCSTHQHDISESNADADLNILFILEIDLTSQPPIGWLKFEAKLKVLSAVVTLPTFQPLIFILKLEAFSKVEVSSWISEVSQLLISLLKEVAFLNTELSLVQFVTSKVITVLDTPADWPLLNNTAPSNILSMFSKLEVVQFDMSWLKTSAPKNIWRMLSTDVTIQLFKLLLLKLSAFWNIANILFTLETFQLDKSPLNAEAFKNIHDISSAAEVSQLSKLKTPGAWPELKLGLLLNIPWKFVTFWGFQPEISWLKFESINISDILVAVDTSHPVISLVKELAPLNILYILTGKLKIQLDNSLSKDVAPQNIPAVLLTFVMSQLEMFPLKLSFLWNMERICLTLEVSHAS